MKIYNGEGILLGRLCSAVAKDALLGEEVKIINCDKVVISGAKRKVFEEEKTRRARKGYPLKSAKRPRLADRYVRRAVRGMLPWKQARGREAFDRVMCYVGVPNEIDSSNAIVLDKASVNKLSNKKYVTISQIMKELGGKE